MPQNRNRHRINQANGTEAEGVSDIAPPPSIMELVKDNPGADRDWKKWLNQQYEYLGTLSYQALDGFITPSSISQQSGGTITGTVTDVQTLQDGNVLNIAETVAGTFDVDFVFESVASFTGLVMRMRYNGSASHVVEVSIYDDDATADDQYLEVVASTSLYQTRTVLFPNNDKYINASDQAIVSLIHTTTPGNNSHSIDVDYVALIGKTT